MQEIDITHLTLPPVIDRLAIIELVEQQFINSPEDPKFDWVLPLVQSTLIESVLIHTYGNQTQAAAMLGIHKETLRRYYRAHTDWKNKKANQSQN
ncbi:helix-turn-helix domain-containing protein [Vibrio campbellii]|uniref:helix-turn-helix domain-containing protein n=1 Tax=Vibrio campbellii TaxID=680 RepID=UPI0005EF39E7|nr:helix-turn-helix domain-containing protein [Vibrio campbellii]